MDCLPDDILLHKIAMSMAKGLQGDSLKELLRRIGSPHDFFRYTQRELSMLAEVQAPVFDQTYRESLLASAHTEKNFVQANDIQCHFITDSTYSERLSACADAPAMYYQLGKADMNSKRVVAVVGTRHATPYGIDFATRLVSDLAKMFPGIVILSGLAYGIDVAAHKAAMAAGTPTVAVLGHGLHMIYPADHRGVAAQIIASGGALVTKYGSRENVHRSNFLARNLIVAGLCDCIVVVESDHKGGSMSTAHAASLYGREVAAVPGRVTDVYSRGTNRLIAQEMAHLITGADDLARLMNWEPEQALSGTSQPALFQPLSQTEQKIYDYILEHPDVTENELCIALTLPYAKICSAVFNLEMKDYILKLPGGMFAPLVK